MSIQFIATGSAAKIQHESQTLKTKIVILKISCLLNANSVKIDRCKFFRKLFNSSSNSNDREMKNIIS